jgi:hypothetical protein
MISYFCARAQRIVSMKPASASPASHGGPPSVFSPSVTSKTADPVESVVKCVMSASRRSSAASSSLRSASSDSIQSISRNTRCFLDRAAVRSGVPRVRPPHSTHAVTATDRAVPRIAPPIPPPAVTAGMPLRRAGSPPAVAPGRGLASSRLAPASTNTRASPAGQRTRADSAAGSDQPRGNVRHLQDDHARPATRHADLSVLPATWRFPDPAAGAPAGLPHACGRSTKQSPTRPRHRSSPDPLPRN